MPTQILSKPKALTKKKEASLLDVAKSVSKKKMKSDKDLAKIYNEFKQFEGAQYTGMKIGRSHKWYYDKGEWRETKITPDLWEIA